MKKFNDTVPASIQPGIVTAFWRSIDKRREPRFEAMNAFFLFLLQTRASAMNTKTYSLPPPSFFSLLQNYVLYALPSTNLHFVVIFIFSILFTRPYAFVIVPTFQNLRRSLSLSLSPLINSNVKLSISVPAAT